MDEINRLRARLFEAWVALHLELKKKGLDRFSPLGHDMGYGHMGGGYMMFPGHMMNPGYDD